MFTCFYRVEESNCRGLKHQNLGVSHSQAKPNDWYVESSDFYDVFWMFFVSDEVMILFMYYAMFVNKVMGICK